MYMQYPGIVRRSNLGRAKILMFLIGLFTETHITLVGSIGISELAILLFSPIAFFRNVRLFRRDGVSWLLILSFLWFAGACLSDYLAHSPAPIMIRGIAHPLMVFATISCIYPILQKDLDSLKWYVLGAAGSTILSIFVFQSHLGAGVEAGSAEAIDHVMGYKLFWTNLATVVFSVPIEGWYLSCPSIYTLFVPLGLAAYCLLSGSRSAFLALLFSFVLLFAAQRRVKNIRRLSRSIFLLLFVMAVAAWGAKKLYRYAAEKGMMGDEERVKYETQTKTGESALKLIMSGRSDFFVSLFAAFNRPLLGWGSHAIDYNDYYGDFIQRYGDEKDIVLYQYQLRENPFVHRLPMHSHLTGFWAWHGIFGLLFWLYALYLIGITLFRRLAVWPPYYGYFALSIPMITWHILFSPFGMRTTKCVLFACCILVGKMKKDKLGYG